jgi:FtsP/CotA-like multicopper oxidase with cupredoxin domain
VILLVCARQFGRQSTSLQEFLFKSSKSALSRQCQLKGEFNVQRFSLLVLTATLSFVTVTPSMAQTSPTPVSPVPNACSRFTAGGVIHNPPALYSVDGVLNVRFSYQTTTDSVGRQLFCFMTPDGLENPTLHVNPGDTLNITVTNNTPFNDRAPGESDEDFKAPTCGDTTFESTIVAPVTSPPPAAFGMTAGSMNIHYHGTNTSPACHEDNVTKTLINPSINPGHPASTFQYNVHFPTNEPPGLYWYHPHVHMLAEAAVYGGASGALIVDGIQNVYPVVGGLSERVIVIRDLPFKSPALSQTCCTNTVDGQVPQRDLSVNFVPLDTTATFDSSANLIGVNYTPGVLYMRPGEQQLWRVCNCNSDAPMDLQVRFDGRPQTIQIVGIDAVPVNSQDQNPAGPLIAVQNFRLPPASRVEFLVNAPPPGVKLAQLVTQFIFSGPLGDTLPTRPLLTMQLANDDTETYDNMISPSTGVSTTHQRFGAISSETPTLTRTVFFEEVEDGSAFFINASGCVTASGAQCPTQPYTLDTPFDNNNAPAIITTQGTVEKWIVQNHARENHELHQHQIHFKVLSQDNFDKNCTTLPTGKYCSQPAPAISNQFLDMIEVPFCGGAPAGLDKNGNVTNPPSPPACVDANGNPSPAYPQVTLLMDFRGPVVGDFVFHCHILGHEDLGMMAIERVK